VEKIDNIKKATRLARAIASDISIYNTDAIVDGLNNDNLFTSLSGELEEGRKLFREKVNEEIVNNTNIFEKAIIDIIIASRGHLKTPIW
jgi:hypothetical protein